jgi:lipopolysaccharide export system protein LptA
MLMAPGAGTPRLAEICSLNPEPCRLNPSRMITRLTHAAIAFAVTAALYQAYVLTVAPFVEPAWRIAQAAHGGEAEEVLTSAEALHRYRDLLSAYFPADHWCFAEPPKALDNGQALIIFNNEEKSTNGQMKIPRCAVIFFPTPRQAGGEPPRDAIILESTNGALLQMEAGDGGIGFGKIQHGVLDGKVVIRSDMREPGPQDDLRLTTEQLNINEDGIHTLSPVDMRLGPHQGFGRELEIRFMKTEGSGGLGFGGIYGKFEELTVKHDVAVKVVPGKLSFFGQPSQQAAAAANQPAPPIHIQSVGPFRIDFAKEVATFSDQVQVRQTHPDGKRDDLRADELNLFFTRTSTWNSGDGTEPAAAGESMAFEPASIEALGSPVTLTAQSHDAAAQGGRLYLELGPRRIRLEKGEEVILKYQGAEIHAPMVQYQLPPEGSNEKVGPMAARGGAGWLRAVVDPAQPSQVLDVRWTDAMQLVRSNGKPVLVLDGRPRVGLAGAGTMWADQLQIFLRETEGPAVAGSSPLAGSVVPEQIKASGRVAIESPQLTGKVNQLEVKFDHGSAADAAGPAAGKVPAAAISTGGATAPAPGGIGSLDLLNATGDGKTYNIEGVTLNLDVAVRGKKANLRGISVDGGVVFKETSATMPGVQPMQIQAEHLQVTEADTVNAHIDIRGAGGTDGLPQQIAELTAHGAKLRVPAIALQRGTSEALVNSPGEVQLLVDRDMAGNPLARPEPLTITWKESMQLRGRELTFLGDVRVQHESGWLRTRRLVVLTVEPVKFDGGGPTPQVEQLQCWEGVLAEFDQRDVTGVTSRQHLELQSLLVNQITGEIRGDGPGTIDSVHLAKGAGNFLAPPGGAAAPAAPRLMNAPVELRHLHIDFVRGVGGNLHTKTVNVIGNVEAVYGPVANWEERLSMSPGGEPGPDCIWITCDDLGVTESPMARLNGGAAREVELKAQGNVVIEGQDKQGKMFNATGGRATYDQSKGLFILEGTATLPATIIQQDRLGAQMSPQSAQRMTYNQNTGIIEVQGLHRGSFNQAPK